MIRAPLAGLPLPSASKGLQNTLMYSKPFHLNPEGPRGEPSIISLERRKWWPDTQEGCTNLKIESLRRGVEKKKYVFEKFLTN